MQIGITETKSNQLISRLQEANVYSEITCLDNVILYYKGRVKGRLWIEKELTKRRFPTDLISQRMDALYTPSEEEQSLKGLWSRYKISKHKNSKARFVATAWRKGFPQKKAFQLIHEED